MEKQYNKKIIGLAAGSVFTLFLLLWIFLTFYTNQRVKEIDVSAMERLAAAGVEYSIDSVNYKDTYVSIKGYAYQAGISVDTVKTAVVLYDAANEKYYELPTESVKKTKLSKKANDGYNYDYAQFEAVALKKKIPDDSQIFILYRVNGSEILVETSEAVHL